MVNDEIELIKTKLSELENRILKLEGASPDNNVNEKKLSIREFLNSFKPDGDVQKTLCVCYFLEMYEKIGFFNAKDVKEGFFRAREPVPDKLSDKIYQNVKKGFLMDYNEKKDNLKTYVLTSSGMDYFKNEE